MPDFFAALASLWSWLAQQSPAIGAIASVLAIGGVLLGIARHLIRRRAAAPILREAIRLDFSYDVQRRDQHEHIYQLRILLVNDGQSTAKSYGFDIWLPKDILSTYRTEQARSLVVAVPEGNEVRFSFRNSDNLMQNRQLLPGDNARVLPQNDVLGGNIDYRMDDKLYQKYKGHSLRFRVYADVLSAPVEGTISFEEWQQY